MKKVLIKIFVAICLIGVAVGITASVIMWGDKGYSKTIDKAWKSFEQMEYEGAIVYFKEAIDINNEKVDTYIWLSKVYEEMEDYNSAIDILKSARKSVNGDDWTIIQKRIRKLEEKQEVNEELQVYLEKKDTPAKYVEYTELYKLEGIVTGLSKGADNKQHYARIESSLTIDTRHIDYEKLYPLVDKFKSSISSIIMDNVAKYSYEDLTNPEIKIQIKEQALDEVQKFFESNFITGITIDYLLQ